MPLQGQFCPPLFRAVLVDSVSEGDVNQPLLHDAEAVRQSQGVAELEQAVFLGKGQASEQAPQAFPLSGGAVLYALTCTQLRQYKGVRECDARRVLISESL